MSITERIKDFCQLGVIMKALGEGAAWTGYELGITEDEYNHLSAMMDGQKHKNAWFEPEQVRYAFQSWGGLLEQEKIEQWLSAYALDQVESKRVGVVMAGNIPLVGFHDFLSVLMAGHSFVGKVAQDAADLVPALSKVLIKLNESWSEKITWCEGKLQNYDAVIATGSNNTARYFEYYFKHVPHIIRKNRVGVALIKGDEPKEKLQLLGKDIFQYFGLGCRNVSKIYVPQDFVLDRFFEAIYDFNPIVNHNKYANNYDYHRAIFLMNKEPFLENGFLSLKENNEQIAAPMGVIFYERYEDESVVKSQLEARKDEIQCVVGEDFIPFGEAQSPALSDYADGVDTMAFLVGL